MIQFRDETGAGPPTERSKLYWEFWEKFLGRVASGHPGWTTAKASTRGGWYDLPAGVSGVVYETVFAHHGLRVGLYFGASDAATNTQRFERLRGPQGQFEQALGQAADWDGEPGKKAATVWAQSEFKDVANIDDWPAMLDWITGRQVKFRHAVDAIGGIGAFA
ncbi:MAG: DUF4268 domain-containing protein [Actinomycetota bacterium]|nr:DUF4268 domain-containing protein [Actinomycetota bacterium]